MVRNADVGINFDTVVGAGGVRSTDTSHSHDLVTAKVLVLELLAGGLGSPQSATTAAAEVNSFWWIVRWRSSLGIASLSALGHKDVSGAPIGDILFPQYCRRFAAGGALNLIPLADRFNQLCQQSALETIPPSIADYARRIGIDANWVVEQLGITTDSAKRASFLVASGLEPPRLTPAVTLALRRITSAASMKLFLRNWQHLAHLSRSGAMPHDPLGFDPFARTSVDDIVAGLGVPQGRRTGTIAPELWLRLIEAASAWVLDYAQSIMNVVQEVPALLRTASPPQHLYNVYKRARPAIQALIDRHPLGPGAPRLAPVWIAQPNSAGIGIFQAVRLVVAACIIVIGAFSARRSIELESLQVDCTHKDNVGQWWITAYIAKTLRDLDDIPVPAIVARAVDILTDLSQSARRTSGEPWLLAIEVHAHDGQNLPVGIYLGRLLSDFAEAVGITAPPESGSDAWVPHPHQLRRCFAMYYYWGNYYGNFDAISRHLRHYNPEMTRRYLTEVANGQLVRLADIQRAAMKAYRAAIARTAAAQSEMELADSAADAQRHQAKATEARLLKAALRERYDSWEEVRQDFLVQRHLQVFDGDEAPIGGGSAVMRQDIEQLVQEAAKKIRLDKPDSNLSPADVRAGFRGQLLKVAASYYLEPVPGGYALCRFRHGHIDDAPQAACLVKKRALEGMAADLRPDYAYASIPTCMGCPLGVALSENKREILVEAATAEKANQLYGEFLDIARTVRASRATR
ncbi:hypothetical protein D2T81_04020 [Azospirillum brasilense]|nr:hypothetical protein D2T81_04020 [Azospirillum brasilense]